jgi:predicted Zn-dependent peptidase
MKFRNIKKNDINQILEIYNFHIKNRLDYLILGESLNIHLNKVIREELGGVYSIGAYQSSQEYPNPIYNFYITFLSDPDRQEELVKRIKKEIQNFMKGNFDDNIVLNATKQSLQNYAEEIETNDFWIDILSFYDWHEEPYDNVFLIKDIHTQRTKQDIVDIANQIFNTENIMEFIQLPK